MLTTTPAADQRERSRALANTIRMQRSALKRAIRDGTLSAAAVLRDPPWYMQSMPLHELLAEAPHVGPDKVRKLNMRAAWAGINLFRPLGETTERQRDWIIAALPVLEQDRAAA